MKIKITFTNKDGTTRVLVTDVIAIVYRGNKYTSEYIKKFMFIDDELKSSFSSIVNTKMLKESILKPNENDKLFLSKKSIDIIKNSESGPTSNLLFNNKLRVRSLTAMDCIIEVLEDYKRIKRKKLSI